jgi:hypothetical protein
MTVIIVIIIIIIVIIVSLKDTIFRDVTFSVFDEFTNVLEGPAGFIFCPGNGGSRCRRNLGKFLPDSTALGIRRQVPFLVTAMINSDVS